MTLNIEDLHQIAKIEKESAGDRSNEKLYGTRFLLRYEGGTLNSDVARTMVATLEQEFSRVGNELGCRTDERIVTVVQSRSAYLASTGAETWTGGVYDGTIRVPFGALSEITPPLRAILFHEYAHVVVFDLTRGNCPVWLNEGIAEMFGRREFDYTASEESQTAAKGTLIMRRLEGSFGGLSSSEAARAYQQSYSLVHYLVDAYGWHRVNAILTGLGKGMNIASAIASALQDYSLSYEGLINEWQASEQR